MNALKNHKIAYELNHFTSYECFVKSLDWRNVSKGSGKVQYVKEFKSSIPLHFDMLNATPYSLSKEGNLVVEVYIFFIYRLCSMGSISVQFF